MGLQNKIANRVQVLRGKAREAAEPVLDYSSHSPFGGDVRLDKANGQYFPERT